MHPRFAILCAAGLAAVSGCSGWNPPLAPDAGGITTTCSEEWRLDLQELPTICTPDDTIAIGDELAIVPSPDAFQSISCDGGPCALAGDGETIWPLEAGRITPRVEFSSRVNSARNGQELAPLNVAPLDELTLYCTACATAHAGDTVTVVATAVFAGKRRTLQYNHYDAATSAGAQLAPGPSWTWTAAAAGPIHVDLYAGGLFAHFDATIAP
jgi:hypothetical protein